MDWGSTPGFGLNRGGRRKNADSVTIRPCGWRNARFKRCGLALATTFIMTVVLFQSASGTALGAVDVGCPPRWVETFSGEDGGVSGGGVAIFDMLTWDDGSGPAIFAAGSFTEAGGEPANRIAKWDGTAWSPLGEGLSGDGVIALSVLELAVFDDGNGEALYAAGRFSHSGETEVANIAKWTGSAWAPLGPGLNNTVNALIVFDDGDGPALYAGGAFTTAVGGVANRVAKWDGTSWTNLEGVATIGALAVYDDGNGPALYAGGNFTSTIDMDGAERIVKWNGQQWEKITPQIASSVNSMAVYDDGTGGGPALFIGGGFRSVDYKETGEIAKWDGTSWWGIRDGVEPGATPAVHALHVGEDMLGNGPVLYVGGRFPTAGGVEASRIAKYGCGPRLTPPDSPILSATTTAAGRLQITWPQGTRVWVLESANSPVAEQGSPVAADVVDEAGLFWSVELPMDAQAEFFWLRLIED
jgi:hypothetical protein